MDKKYDIFISYRRDGGDSAAKLLRDRLTEAGYHVFFDVDSLYSGDFNTKLYSVIDECKDFVLILSPNALDRCKSEDDWVRLEIEHALAKKKNIIPILLRGFSFPENLPDSIEALRYKNGVESNYQFFDAFMEKLQSFLVSKQKKTGLGTWLAALKRWLPLLVLVLLVATGTGIGLKAFGNYQHSYPRTKAEKNVTNNFLYYIENNLLQLEQAAGYLSDSYAACDQYLNHIDTTDRNTFLATLQKYRRSLYQMDISSSEMTDSLHASLMDSPYSLADAVAMHDYLVEFRQDCIDNIYYMEYLTDPENFIEQEVRENILNNYREILSEELNTFAYGTNLLLLPATDEDALQDFKYVFMPQLYYIPLTASTWELREDVLKSAEEKSWNTMDRILDRIAVLVGESNMERMQDRADMIQELTDAGFSPEEAEETVERILGKSDLLEQTRQELQDKQQQLEEMKEKARMEFAPEATDEPGILWGKMLRFLKIKLYDEALNCLDYYREAVRDTDEYAEEYCAAAARLIRNISKTGIDYGLIVVGYEPEMPQNEQYLIGDVIISLNGTPCHNYEEFSLLRSALDSDENYNVVVLREKDDGSGSLEQLKLTIPADAPRVMLMNMAESSD